MDPKWITRELRRISYRYPARTEAKRAARTERGKYRCAACGGIFRAGEIQLDHVVPVSSFDNFDAYIGRMFPPVDGWQVLCESCHKAKSAREAGERAKKSAD